MAFGVIVSCANCKFAGSQIFFNAKKERICFTCIQTEHDNAIANLERSFDEMYKLKQENDKIIAALDAIQKIEWNSVIREALAQYA